MNVEELSRALRAQASPGRAREMMRFFKTGPGQYGEGDRFLGLSVPQVRALLRPARALPLESCATLLHSEWHEERLMGALMLDDRARRALRAGEDAALRAIHDLYLAERAGINNWDLVDCSAPRCVGAWLWERDRRELYRLATSRRMWDRRVAVLATFFFIDRQDFDDALGLCARLLQDPEDLMHKACGWMLREVGKRGGLTRLRGFLKAHGRSMPRTMLRYSIERLPAPERQDWLERTRP